MINRLLITWVFLTVALLAVNLADVPWPGSRPLTTAFFLGQDAPLLVALMIFELPILAGLLIFKADRRPAPGPLSRLAAALDRVATSPALRAIAHPARPWRAVALLAAACGLIGWIGTWLVYDGYALSMDEFMANFDATILAHGQLMARVAPAWRADLPALGPQFLFHPGGGAYWMSSYLPVNAALRALGAIVGARSLVSPLLAAISVIAVFGVGRRLWPDRPQIAWFAAIMLATSSQVLVTAMTPYAMTAHLAFNLVWLWLFLGKQWWCHAGAIVVGFLACGIHQLIFHPLFVAPFILQLWLDRRWRLAAIYTLAYAGICLFWVDYANLALKTVEAVAAVAPIHGGRPQGGAAWVLNTLRDLLAAFSWTDVGLIAKNLIRYATWQNLLTAPLLVLGSVAAVRAKGAPRALVLGLVLTLAAVLALLAYQGHGWGYRYVHGLLGSGCLLAAWTWAKIDDGVDEAGKARSRAVFLAVTAASMLVLFPIRAWQAHTFVDPYARADAEIRAVGTDAVIVDDAGTWFGADLVRNDPYLTNRPLVFDRAFLNDAQLRALCARHTVTMFDQRDAARSGIRTFAVPKRQQPTSLKPLPHDLKCGMTPVATADKP